MFAGHFRRTFQLPNVFRLRPSFASVSRSRAMKSCASFLGRHFLPILNNKMEVLEEKNIIVLMDIYIGGNEIENSARWVYQSCSLVLPMLGLARPRRLIITAGGRAGPGKPTAFALYLKWLNVMALPTSQSMTAPFLPPSASLVFFLLFF